MSIRLSVIHPLCCTIALASCGRDKGETSPDLGSLPSVSRCISPDELDLFEAGATIEEITEALNGRGNFLFAYRDPDGTEHAVVDFGVSPGAPSPFADLQKTVWAVFEDGRFTKLVPAVGPEQERYEPGRWRYKDPSIVAGLRHTRRVVESLPLSIEETRRTVKPGDHRVDWGLTIAVAPLLLKIRARLVRDARANAPLRATFDGRLVRLGESPAIVEERFGEPTRTWEEGEFSVSSYGATAGFSVSMPRVHHCPVLVAYRNGLASIIFGYDFVRMVVPGPEHQ